MSRLLPNLPIEDLTPENDYLGVIEKGNMIKNFLLLNTEEFSEIKMFALYGEWGSGKSTLMKYLQKELQDSCNTYFFEAWEFESDSNLPISLLEDLMDKSESISEKRSGEILQIAEDLFVGFAKSLRINIPGLSINGKEVIQALEKKPTSFLQLKKKFKKEFQKWENIVIKDDLSKFNLIFIDDLDRCEPENVLNLLSALKLFFTYGNKTIYFCGVDKKAINAAVKTKYGDVVKSKEYLEKVFDLSFSMPKNPSLDKLLGEYFSSELAPDDRQEETWLTSINAFFKEIHFSNPRKIKKVLNKFSMFRVAILDLDNKKKPNINQAGRQNGSFYETIIVLYFIILKEFHDGASNILFNFQKKKTIYANAVDNNTSIKIDSRSSEITNINYFLDSNASQVPLSSLPRDWATYRPYFLICISSEAKLISHNCFNSLDGFNLFVPIEKNIEYYFFKFFVENEDNFINSKVLSESSLISIERLIDNSL